ncbi:tryptophan-rich sensory protein [Salinimicrobium oceani]|uniref:Tryptophan-rich sensory protein n=1 Tax=Salinimicrobium oceani TaxID=2722702 RepID=A0ABX1D2P4_9FLAO|nr:tryptophan-rich sensory protein [Salinimicrobium oceani]NJW52826.1 tryptophan-rich sensory protein [Salinimicrobium oceani]
MKKILYISNIVAFLVMLAVNYISNTGVINAETMASISAEYQNLFTPAGYAFSIWGVIYLALAGFVIFQISTSRGRETAGKIGWWFVITCGLNIAWVFAWLHHLIGLSLFLMVLLLVALIVIIFKTRMELDDEPLSIIAFVWWPFSFYSGWISVALIANTAAWFTAVGWEPFGFSEVAWTVIMVLVALILNLMITWRRNMREFALVGAWGLIAVGIANRMEHETIFFTSIIAAGILILSSGIHGYMNKEQAPWKKL